MDTHFLCVTKTETYQTNGSCLGTKGLLWPPHICTHVRQGRGERELRGVDVFCGFKLLAWPAKPVDVFNLPQETVMALYNPLVFVPLNGHPPPHQEHSIGLVDLYTYL